MSPGADWSPVLPIRQPAATCWYHANTHNRMALHVYNGRGGAMAGGECVKQVLLLPNYYSVNDFSLIVQDKRLDNFGAGVQPTRRRRFLRRYLTGERCAVPLS